MSHVSTIETKSFQDQPLSCKIKSGLCPPHICGFPNAPTFLQEIILVCPVYQLTSQSFKISGQEP